MHHHLEAPSYLSFELFHTDIINLHRLSLDLSKFSLIAISIMLFPKKKSVATILAFLVQFFLSLNHMLKSWLTLWAMALRVLLVKKSREVGVNSAMAAHNFVLLVPWSLNVSSKNFSKSLEFCLLPHFWFMLSHSQEFAEKINIKSLISKKNHY